MGSQPFGNHQRPVNIEALQAASLIEYRHDEMAFTMMHNTNVECWHQPYFLVHGLSHRTICNLPNTKKHIAWQHQHFHFI